MKWKKFFISCETGNKRTGQEGAKENKTLKDPLLVTFLLQRLFHPPPAGYRSLTYVSYIVESVVIFFFWSRVSLGSPVQHWVTVLLPQVPTAEITGICRHDSYNILCVYLCLWVCTWAYAYHSTFLKVIGLLVGVSSLLPSGSWRWNSGHLVACLYPLSHLIRTNKCHCPLIRTNKWMNN